MYPYLTLILWVLIASHFGAAIARAEDNPPPPPVQIREENEQTTYTLPSGTPLMAVLQSPIHTALNQPNQEVLAAVTQDIYVHTEKIITKNARLKGHITVIEPPIIGKNAVLGFQFDSLILENGDVLPIQGQVRTGNKRKSWGGELTPGTEYQVVTHRIMGLGAYNKAVLTGPREMGKHLEFRTGDHVIITLMQPIQIEIHQPSFPL